MAFVYTKVCTSLEAGLRLLPRILQPATKNFHSMVKTMPSPVLSVSPVTTTAAKLLPAVPIIGLQKLLAPFNTLLTQVAGFKVKGRIKCRCKDCYIVIRQQRHYVICPTHPRHKQMSMKKREYKSWILTHATQSKIRGY